MINERLKEDLLNMIKVEFKAYLKECRKGVEQGGLIVECEEVVGRFGRTSKNPIWYRDLYKEVGRYPTDKMILKRVIKFMRHGERSEGIPQNKIFKSKEIDYLYFDKPIEQYITCEMIKRWVNEN